MSDRPEFIDETEAVVNELRRMSAWGWEKLLDRAADEIERLKEFVGGHMLEIVRLNRVIDVQLSASTDDADEIERLRARKCPHDPEPAEPEPERETRTWWGILHGPQCVITGLAVVNVGTLWTGSDVPASIEVREVLRDEDGKEIPSAEVRREMEAKDNLVALANRNFERRGKEINQLRVENAQLRNTPHFKLSPAEFQKLRAEKDAENAVMAEIDQLKAEVARLQRERDMLREFVKAVAGCDTLNWANDRGINGGYECSADACLCLALADVASDRVLTEHRGD
jgi:hypothetical protein